ncbi:DUF4350 domain-containing protein [Pseudarthrobacter sp. N5]|uniref:DUF4350 domain-containing protein n=1 Tax=Pseudarthrobacter sp. N5 TaxID=3418416 RepID=UPI003CF9D176
MSTFHSWILRHRAWAAILAVFSAALVITLVTQLTPRGDGVPLSVLNAAPDGAMAVAEILGKQGVDVQPSGSFPETMTALRARPGATVLLYDRNGFLDPDQLAQLMKSGGRTVVVTPRLNTLTGLGGVIRQSGVVPASAITLDAGCSVPDTASAGPITADSGYLYTGGTVCYRPFGTGGGMYASSADGKLVVLGSTGIISNNRLADHGNAALVLRTLGSDRNLIWYFPGLADVTAGGSPPTLDELAPEWAAFLGPWLAFVALLAILWRGRRLGPLVFEPLPVIVKAVETAEGRARLYHDAHAVDRARHNLRAGTLVRLAKTLRQGADAGTADVVAAVADYLGRPLAETDRLLNAVPRNETELLQWAQELDRLEKEVDAR